MRMTLHIQCSIYHSELTKVCVLLSPLFRPASIFEVVRCVLAEHGHDVTAWWCYGGVQGGRKTQLNQWSKERGGHYTLNFEL